MKAGMQRFLQSRIGAGPESKKDLTLVEDDPRNLQFTSNDPNLDAPLDLGTATIKQQVPTTRGNFVMAESEIHYQSMSSFKSRTLSRSNKKTT